MSRTTRAELAERGQSFRSLAEHAPVMLWITDPAGRCRLLNRSWRAFRGLGSADDGDWDYGVHDDDRDAARTTYQSAHGSREGFTVEYRVRRADGVYRWVRDRGTPWLDDDGRFLGHIGCCIDVTDLRRYESTVDAAKRRLELLVETSKDLVYRVRLFPSPAVEYMGGAVEAITGHTAEEFYADAYLARRAVHPDDAQAIAMTSDEADHLPATATYRWIHSDGHTVWADHYRLPIFDAGGRIIALEGLARDVTHRIESERRLRESEEQMRQLAARLQTAREEERTEVSRELHDEVGQTLTALKLEINRAVAAFVSDPQSVTTVDRLQSVVGLVDLGIATVKRISARLRPATLDHLGLAEAVRWEALTFKARTGIRCQVRANRQHTKLSAEQQTALFRIVQEALNNVVCHANASAVQISIKETIHEVELRIHDNGGGISAAHANNPGSIGLLGMSERAALVGGTFKISGQRGKGTVVSVHVPVTHSAVNRPRSHPESPIG
jgi:two-component system sensor histidine kinase UhpB